MACVLEDGRLQRVRTGEVRFIPREKPDREGRGMSEPKREIPPPWKGGGRGGEPRDPSRRR